MSEPIDWAQFPTIEQARTKAEWAFAEIARLRAELAAVCDDLLTKKATIRELQQVLTAATHETLRAIHDRDDIARRDAEEIARLRELLGEVLHKIHASTELAERIRAALAPRPEGKGE